jgi:hypothetical protein
MFDADVFEPEQAAAAPDEAPLDAYSRTVLPSSSASDPRWCGWTVATAGVAGPVRA